jgi:hypothetical protein
VRLGPLRWGLPGLFLIGYVVCDRAIGPLEPSFAMLTALNAAALLLLLSRLSGPLQYTLWVWSALAVFITGTFLKMYWFAWHLNSPGYINSTFVELRWVDSVRIHDGYRWATLGFTVFCISATFALLWTTRVSTPVQEREDHYFRSNTALQMVIGLMLSYLLLSLLQLKLNYGVLGVNNPVLPGRVGTVLTFARQQAIPALLLLAVWLFDQTRRTLAAIPACFLVAAAVIDALVSTSRGSVLALSAPLVLLWLMTGRLDRGRRPAVALIALTGVILFPIVTASRQAKLNPGSVGPTGIPSFQALVDSSFFIVTRPSGIEGVWYSQDNTGRFTTERTLKYLRPGALTTYYTRTIVRVPGTSDFRAPGLIGALMIIGGSAGVVVLMAATMLGLGAMWSALSRLQTWPVALALAGPAVAIFVSGGVFDFLSLVKVVLQAALCEVIGRRLVRIAPASVTTEWRRPAPDYPFQALSAEG